MAPVPGSWRSGTSADLHVTDQRGQLAEARRDVRHHAPELVRVELEAQRRIADGLEQRAGPGRVREQVARRVVGVQQLEGQGPPGRSRAGQRPGEVLAERVQLDHHRHAGQPAPGEDAQRRTPQLVGEPHGRLELQPPAIARSRIIRIPHVAGSLDAGSDADQRDAQPRHLDGPGNLLDRLIGPGELDGVEPGRPDGQEALQVGQLREQEADVHGKAHQASSRRRQRVGRQVIPS